MFRYIWGILAVDMTQIIMINEWKLTRILGENTIRIRYRRTRNVRKPRSRNQNQIKM